MILVLLAAKAGLSAIIFILVWLAFLPHSAASLLTGAQKLLSEEIKRRQGAA